jgi:hypothetical protein
MVWRRRAADNGFADAWVKLANTMYLDRPYAREVGRCRFRASEPVLKASTLSALEALI